MLRSLNKQINIIKGSQIKLDSFVLLLLIFSDLHTFLMGILRDFSRNHPRIITKRSNSVTPAVTRLRHTTFSAIFKLIEAVAISLVWFKTLTIFDFSALIHKFGKALKVRVLIFFNDNRDTTIGVNI